MKLDLEQDLGLGRLTVTMTENCHGDSKPLIDRVQFNRFHEKIAPDTAALAAGIIASRWCGNILEFPGLKLGADMGEAVQLLAPEPRFIQPIDGYRRQLCEGNLDLLVAPAGMAGAVLSAERDGLGMTRLVTWSGEFVDRKARSSERHVAGEISTNAGVLLPDWEVSACLGLLVGGLSLRSITIPQPDRKSGGDFERIATALWTVGIALRVAGPAPRLSIPAGQSDSVDRSVGDSTLAELAVAAA